MLICLSRSVSEVYGFVRGSLREPGRDFILCTLHSRVVRPKQRRVWFDLTPPKKVLASMDETLYKASLSPASVVWFSWKSGVARECYFFACARVALWSDRRPLKGWQDGPYLADSWLKRMEDLPLALAPETQGQQRPEAQQDGNDVKCERVNPGGVTRSDVARGSKMTKWLKIGACLPAKNEVRASMMYNVSDFPLLSVSEYFGGGH
ncbi:MAG: hypothetical protein BJ554DRAFT_674 [Olpidium bornovanus]|uniref:Uncharacterized protein n=1 Tax=Olpidium bornovanus TaxID=278681 RepID=A0A8H7ZTE7_9FUNG|nr:MAG: hypothetical protein BJ554DRAFT_674 [Olpidium bornovanus]